ncbi:MAG: ribonuclease HII [Kiritimatiellaeota bacterium]|nr:ribonuclease HII [Kiritimatiellota bacterium]
MRNRRTKSSESRMETRLFAPNSPMLKFERRLWSAGIEFVAGIDEAGRGPLAGPVVVAAVVFTNRGLIPVVNDSKQLTAAKRETLVEAIKSAPGVWTAVVEISPEEIDELNILRATHRGMRAAAAGVASAEFALIDGLPVPDFPVPCESIVKGDAKSASIAAASILAKTRRDEIMREFHEIYPEYGFDHNSGYGTAEHLAALREYGATPIHRRSFSPVRDVIDPPPEQLELQF